MGWIGSPATERYLFSIADALLEVHRRTGATLEIISGAGTVPQRLAAFTRRRRWTPGATRSIGAWDVGLMPLADDVYERAKCGYKLLQYAASAVPAVASPVGVNAALLAKMDGIAAVDPADWVDAIVELLSEPAARREHRAAAGLATAQAYSYDAWERRWRAAAGW
jgi:glycosyltransferase involved in cell wall biosynthesis